MSYKAIYRIYRPKYFREVFGQKHIVKTFQNALKDNKIAHAYLFSGPRGTGKTSIAKIIGNTLNCEKFPISEPCGQCPSCVAVQKNIFSDIIEIDAASNNGVDEIRELRDKVKYTPSQGRYKVYIVDEVHMLSIGAFNALLKTLEEPPKYVVFILATTEPHKIPVTIQSRCQRFDFKEIATKDIKRKLNKIVSENNISVAVEAIDEIAEIADGALRDAESLLDQILSYADDYISLEDVHAVVGTVSNQNIITLVDAIYTKNSTKAIQMLNEFTEAGKEVNRVALQLVTFLKDLLVFKNVDDSNAKILFKDGSFQKLAERLPEDVIFYYIDCLVVAMRDMRFISNPRSYLEITFIKMVTNQNNINTKLIKRIEQLEKTLSEKQINEKPISQTEQKQSKEVGTLNSVVEVFETKSMHSQPIYDINTISNILDSAMRNKQESKQLKQSILDNWSNILKRADANLFVTAKIFSDCRVEAVWGNSVILTYPALEVVNQLNRSDVRGKMLTLISKVYGKEYNYIILPTQVWDSKRKEFIDKFTMGTIPILEDIKFPGLNLFEEVRQEPKAVRDAISLFGSKKVNIK